ncbi:hypothetical protein SO694_00070192 [Aureococcus anophagefferens]|uniref:EF-hand domain-containing protein n=1 Tax=Aureococcus anophagefferens TaxID=44056 RepID=A0ABR1FZL6_AURAN
MGEAEPGLAEDGEGRDIVEMMLVVAPPQHSTGTPRRSPAGRKRRSDAGRKVKGLGEIASIAKLRNMFMGNVTAMQSYGSMMNYDKDGEHIKLTPQQIKKAFEHMGHKLTAVEIADLFKRIDSDGNGEIEFDEFAQIMSEPARVCRRMQKDEWLESMRAAFASFDKDGSGSISVEELREVLVENLGQQVSDDELDRLVKLADANGDGEIDFDEFKALMHTEQIVTGHE